MPTKFVHVDYGRYSAEITHPDEPSVFVPVDVAVDADGKVYFRIPSHPNPDIATKFNPEENFSSYVRRPIVDRIRRMNNAS